MKLFKILFVSMLFFATHMSAKKIYVNNNSTVGDVFTFSVGLAANNGTTTTTPKLTLAQAYGVAVAGDTIYIDKGTYNDNTLTLGKALTIIGAGTGNTIFDNGAGNQRFATITVSNVIFKNLSFVNYYYDVAQGQVFMINSGVTGILFENVVIRKNPGATVAGNGANVYMSSGSVVTFNTSVISCSGWNADGGGSIFVDNSNLTVNTCLFIDDRNFADWGGAIKMFNASPVVTVNNTTFNRCSSRRGGAIYQGSGTLLVKGSYFSDNFTAGDASDPTNGGGAFYKLAGTTTFSNCVFTGNYNDQVNNPNNGSVDGGAILLRSSSGSINFNTCKFSSNTPFDKGSDFYLDGATATGTITNCTFGPSTGASGSAKVNIYNNNLPAGAILLSNSNSLTFTGTNFTAVGSNTLSPTSLPTAVSINTNIASCSSAINCATETLPPIILSCVPDKTLTGSSCSSVLGNYVPEVVAFDDCAFTVTQNPAPGTLVSGVITVTMTVTDTHGNSTICTFLATAGTGGVSLAVNATTSVTCFGGSTGAATVIPSGGSGTYTVTWMPGALTGTVQTGLAANVYTVSATDGTCTATKSVTISGPLSPVNVSLTITSSTICSNNSVTITPTGASTYTLNPGALTGTSFTVSPTSNTTYTLTGTSVAGCVSNNLATTLITVNATPTVNIPTDNISLCSGNSLVLPAVSGGTDINWSGPNSYTSSVSSPTVTNSITNANAGIYSVFISNTYGSQTCSSAISQVTVSVVLSASITVANTDLCIGSTATITPQGGSTYTLLPSAISGLSFTLNPISTTSYTVLGSAGSGCNGNTTFTVNVNPLPILTASSVNTIICSGGIAVVSITGADSYVWSTTETASTITVSPMTTTSYSATGTNTLTGCSNTASITINVTPTPTIGISASATTICLGNTTTITLTGASTYTLMSPVQTTTNTIVLTPTVLTTYTIMGEAQGCSSATETITIDVNQLPILATTNATICSGSSVTLAASGADTYQWQPTGATTSTTTVTPTTNSTYTVTGTNTLTGCTSTLTMVDVTVNALPTLTATANPNLTCTSGTVNLTAASTATSYTWTIGNGINTGNQNQGSITFPASSLTTGMYIYTVTASDTNGCVSISATTTLNVINVPNANFDLSDLVICQNENGTISINTPQANVVYDWSINGQTLPNANPLTVPSTVTGVAGTYTVSVLASLGTCTNTAANTLTVNALPSVTLMSSQVSACENASAQLAVASPVTTYTYTWTNGQTVSTGTSLSINPLTPSTQGTYTVTVIDQNGCQNRTTGLVDMQLCETFVPEFFSPNGDGVNDGFVIKNIENYPNNQLKIFNRWGNLVYQKDGYSNEFLGYANVGDAAGKSKLPAGTYYVILVYGDDKTEAYNGYLLLQY